MILAHVHNAWLDASSQWMEGLLYCVLSPMGVPGFVFVSGLSFGFSWENNAEKGLNYRKNFNYQLSRTIVLIIVALIYNLVQLIMNFNNYIINNMHPWFLGPLGVICNIWYWSILFTLGFSRLFGAYTMRLSKIGRIVLSIAIILITPVIIQSLEATRSMSVIAELSYWILFNNITQDSVVIFFPCFLIGSVIGQEICLHSKTNSFTNLKNILLAGIIFFISGILSGLRGLNSSQTVWAWTDEFATNPNWNITETPMFLIKNEFPWLLYSCGWLMILTVFIYYKIDYKIQPKKAYFFELYGKYSLTIYITHYVCYILPFEFSYKEIGFAFLLFMLVIWIGMFFIDTKGKGKTSLEFIMAIESRKLSNYMINRLKTKNIFENDIKSK